MAGERAKWGVLIDPAERMQEAMLGYYDLSDELGLAGFPDELIAEFDAVRRKFVDEFERRFPGYGKGRATWK